MTLVKANGRKYRNAIEHIDIIDPSDIPRFAETGTVASMQPSHVALFLADNKKGMGDRLRCNGLFKTILASGAHIASGTDNVVTRFDPVLTLYYSVTNCDLSGNQVGSPAECMSLAEALKCYTYEGAYLNRMEDRLGTLEVGKYADIAVMDENPFDDLPENVRERKNVCTIFEGKIVYERSSGQ